MPACGDRETTSSPSASAAPGATAGRGHVRSIDPAAESRHPSATARRHRCGSQRRRVSAPRPRAFGATSVGVRRPDQAADHRAAARHHGPDDVPRRSGASRPSGWSSRRWSAARSRAGGGQHAQLLHRPRHRRADAPHRAAVRWSPARSARARRSSSASSSAVVSIALARAARQLAVRRAVAGARSSSTSSSTRCCSSGAPRRTSSGAASPAACRCSSAGRPSPDSLSWAPLVLFLVIFFWTPPHYWPLSMRFKDDYAAAGRADAAGRRRQRRRRSRGRSSPTAGRWCRRRWPGAGRAAWAGSTRSSPSCSAPSSCCEAHRLLARAKAAETSPRPSLKPMRLFHWSITLPHAALRRRRDRPAPAPAALRRSARRAGDGSLVRAHPLRSPRAPGYGKVGFHPPGEGAPDAHSHRTYRLDRHPAGGLRPGRAEQLPRRLVRRVVPQARRRGRRRDDEPRGAHRGRALLLLRDAAVRPASPRPVAPRSRWT